MNKNIKNLICFALAICMILSLLSACKNTEDANIASSVISENNGEAEAIQSNPQAELLSLKLLSGETSDGQNLVVDNTKVQTANFGGINMVYSLFNYMPDKFGRVYDEEQIALEHKVLKDMRIKMVRSFYGSTLAWDPVTQKHDYESPYMMAFYKNCKELAEMGIDIGITMQWSLEGFIQTSKANAQTVDIYKNGYVVPNDLTATANNFATFTKESVLAFAQQGITNIKYIFAFTECNNMYQDSSIGGTSDQKRQYEKVYPVFDAGIKALDKGLKDAGLRSAYKIVGPCDAGNPSDDERDYSRLVKYVADNLSDKVDIIGSHHGGYATAQTYDKNEFYNAGNNLQTVLNQAKAMNKEYWIDEFNVNLSNNKYGPDDARNNKMPKPMKGVALGAAINSVMNTNGVANMFLWSLFDQQWPDSVAAGASSEFDNGIHITGYIPSYLETTIPRKPWYALSLLTRYVQSGDTYECTIGDSVYISAIKRADNEWTVVVTNYNTENTPVNINFASSMGGKTFYRYLYDDATIEPVQGAEMIDASAVANNVTVGFADELPATSVAVYTTEQQSN